MPDPVGMSNDSPERPWPLPPPAHEPFDLEPQRGGGRGSTAFRIILLLGLLAAVTAAGIVAGRAVEPASTPTSPPVTTVATTTVPPPKPTPPAPVVRPVTLRWGPLRATSVGRLPNGGGQAGAALVGQSLVVVGGNGSARILAGPPDGQLTVVGALPVPREAMAVFAAGGKLWALGGESGGKPTDAVLRIDLAAGRAKPAGTFEEPLAESGVVSSQGSAYLAGGWTGTQYASAVLQFTPPSTVRLVARLPEGVRSPAVTLSGRTLYVAGGATASGPSTAVYAVDLDTGGVASLGQLPQPVVGGVLFPARGKLYLTGGTTTRDRPSGAVIAIDPATGSPALVGRLTRPLVGAVAVPAGARPLVVDAPYGSVYRVR